MWKSLFLTRLTSLALWEPSETELAEGHVYRYTQLVSLQLTLQYEDALDLRLARLKLLVNLEFLCLRVCGFSDQDLECFVKELYSVMSSHPKLKILRICC